MTTRAQLESELEALIRARASAWYRAGEALASSPLTASIARVEALLSLSDEQCAEVAGALNYRNNSHVPNASAYRTVAEIVRRS